MLAGLSLLLLLELLLLHKQNSSLPSGKTDSTCLGWCIMRVTSVVPGTTGVFLAWILLVSAYSSMAAQPTFILTSKPDKRCSAI